MPADLLTTSLAVGPLAPGASVTLAHGINYGGQGRIPNIVTPDRATYIGVVGTPTATTITFQNFGQAGDSAVFFVELEHTYQRDTTSSAANYWRGGSGQTAQSVVSVGAGIVNVYVNSLIGTSTGLGTKASPLRGPDDVLAKYPIFPFSSVAGISQIIVHYANSLNQYDDDLVYSATATKLSYASGQFYTYSAFGFAEAYVHRGPQFVRAVGLASGPTIVGVGVVKTLSTPAGTKRTRMTFGTSPGWTVNDLKGRMARFINTLTGNQVIFEIPISLNAANSIDLDDVFLQPFLAADLANMTVEICDPGAEVTGLAANFGILSFAGGGFGVNPSIFIGNVQGAGAERLGFPSLFSFGGGCPLDRCTIGGAAAVWGSGWSFYNCTTKPFGVQTFSALTLMNGFSGPRVDGRPDTASSPEDHTSDGGLELVAFGSLAAGFGQGNSGFDESATPFFFTAHRNVSAYDGGIGGIIVGIKSSFITRYRNGAQSPGNFVAIQGTGNIGAGWIVHADGLAAFDSPSANPGLITLTGSTGDLKVLPELAATPTGILYGTGAGQFEQAVGWNGNYTHVLSATTPTSLILGSAARICTRPYAT